MTIDQAGDNGRAEAVSKDRLAALADEHAYITSVDTCCFCSDGECDGIGCIASIDVERAGGGDPVHLESLENLHELLRQGQAWRVMQTLRMAGAEPLDALVVAAAALENANNQWPPYFTDGEATDA